MQINEGFTGQSPFRALMAAQSIIFHLPSGHRWFLPYSSLLYGTLNPDKTKLCLHYTRWLVTIVGSELVPLHEMAAAFQLDAVRESPSPRPAGVISVSRIEIIESTASTVGETGQPKPESRLKAYSTASRSHSERPLIDPKHFQSTPHPPPKGGEEITR